MGTVDVTTRRHRRRLFTTFVAMKPHSVITLGAIIGQADNVMLSEMQSVPAHPNKMIQLASQHSSHSLFCAVSFTKMCKVCHASRQKWPYGSGRVQPGINAANVVFPPRSHPPFTLLSSVALLMQFSVISVPLAFIFARTPTFLQCVGSALAQQYKRPVAIC